MTISGHSILVTGGAGFVGSHLVERLAGENDVLVLDNLLYGSRENLAGIDSTLVIDDVRTADIAGMIAEKRVDTVFHLAAYHLGDSLSDPLTDLEISGLGGLRVLEAARVAGVQRVVYASTGSVYGEPAHTDHDETHPLLPTTPYGVSKTATDHYCRLYNDFHGLPTVRLRYYNVYGPRRLAGAIPKFMLTALSGGTIRIEGGEQVRTPTHVADIVGATLRAAEVPAAAGHAFNIAASDAISILDMAKLIVELCDTQDRVAIERVGYRPGEIMVLRPSVEKARTIMDWTAKFAIRDGFVEMIDHLRTTEAAA